MLSDSRNNRSLQASLARAAIVLGWDALAACAGLWAALQFSPTVNTAGSFWTLAPALVMLRLFLAAALRLHRWSFARAGDFYGARLVAAVVAGSAAFALIFPDLATALYVGEGLATFAFMSALRVLPRVMDAFDRVRLPEAQARFVRQERARRLLNIVVALVGLVLTLPVWAIIAIAVKLTSRGPVLYKQERIGLDLRATQPHRDDPRRKVDLGGRPFMMYKFRTMRVDAESGTGAVWSSGKADPRVTPIGGFLRHCRLDELPQLINVLKGDMNVVGPRPERAPIFAELREKIPNYTTRQRARPGITGFAQVHLEYDATLEDVAQKVQYDVAYVKNQGFFLDFYIMLRTLPVMLFRDRMLRSQSRREPTPAPAVEPRAVESLVRTQG